MASTFLMFLDHTQRRTTASRTPLDDWSARRTDLYLTTHTTLTTDKYPCPRWDSNPRSQQASDRRPTLPNQHANVVCRKMKGKGDKQDIWKESSSCVVADCVWNVMAHAQKPYFVFRLNGRVHLNRPGRQFSRLLEAEVCVSAIVMLDTPCFEVVWRVLATHSIRQFPLHFPSLRRRVPSCFNWTLLTKLSFSQNTLYSML
jgi:hypothetical protein